jgi:hypothetical protein
MRIENIKKLVNNMSKEANLAWHAAIRTFGDDSAIAEVRASRWIAISNYWDDIDPLFNDGKDVEVWEALEALDNAIQEAKETLEGFIDLALHNPGSDNKLKTLKYRAELDALMCIKSELTLLEAYELEGMEY